MRPSTIEHRRRLYLLARVVIARHYNQPLTLEAVAKALACSPRQLTRAFAQFGGASFRDELLTRRLTVAAQLLAGQPTRPVREVAWSVGYRQAPHFAQAFRRRYGLTPARFRVAARAGTALAGSHSAASMAPAGARLAAAEDATVSVHLAEQARRAPTQPVPRPAGVGASACRPLERGGR